MTHLVLKLSSDVTEQVDSTCIADLYYLSSLTGANALDNSSYLSGRINASSAVRARIEAIHTLDNQEPPQPVASTANEGKWDDLYATATAYAIEFTDSAFEQYVLTIISNPTTAAILTLAPNEFFYLSNPSSSYNHGFRKNNSRLSDTFSQYSPNITSLDDLKYFTTLTKTAFEAGVEDNTLTSITVPGSVTTFELKQTQSFKVLKTIVIENGPIVSRMFDIPSEAPYLETFYVGSTNHLGIGGNLTNLSGFLIDTKGLRLTIRNFHPGLLSFSDFVNSGFDENNWLFDNSWGYSSGLYSCKLFEKLPSNDYNTHLPTSCYYDCPIALGYVVLPSVLEHFNGGLLFASDPMLNGVIFTNSTPPTYANNSNHHFASNGEWSRPNIVSTFKILVPNTSLSTFQDSGIMNLTYRNGGIPKDHLHGYTLWEYTGSWAEVSPDASGKMPFSKVKNASDNYTTQILLSTAGSEQNTLSSILNPVANETCAVLYY